MIFLGQKEIIEIGLKNLQLLLNLPIETLKSLESLVPHHKSCKKRLRVASKQNAHNRTVRSSIRTSLKLIRTAKEKEVVEKEMPLLFSKMDKAARRRDAGFNKNRVANYKRKVFAVLNSFE